MDILLDILTEMVKAHPDSVFVNSLLSNYLLRRRSSKCGKGLGRITVVAREKEYQ